MCTSITHKSLWNLFHRKLGKPRPLVFYTYTNSLCLRKQSFSSSSQMLFIFPPWTKSLLPCAKAGHVSHRIYQELLNWGCAEVLLGRNVPTKCYGCLGCFVRFECQGLTWLTLFSPLRDLGNASIRYKVWKTLHTRLLCQSCRGCRFHDSLDVNIHCRKVGISSLKRKPVQRNCRKLQCCTTALSK